MAFSSSDASFDIFWVSLLSFGYIISHAAVCPGRVLVVWSDLLGCVSFPASAGFIRMFISSDPSLILSNASSALVGAVGVIWVVVGARLFGTSTLLGARSPASIAYWRLESFVSIWIGGVIFFVIFCYSYNCWWPMILVDASVFDYMFVCLIELFYPFVFAVIVPVAGVWLCLLFCVCYGSAPFVMVDGVVIVYPCLCMFLG